MRALVLVVITVRFAAADPPAPRAPVICGSGDRCIVVVPDGATDVELYFKDLLAKATVRGPGGEKRLTPCAGGACAKVKVSAAWKVEGAGRSLVVERVTESDALASLFDKAAGGCPWCSTGPLTTTVPRPMVPRGFDMRIAITGELSSTVQKPEKPVKPVVGPGSETPTVVGPEVRTLAPDDTAFGDVVLVGGRSFTCSGVLVATRVVLTAAHCLPATRVAFASRADQPVLEVAVATSHAHETADVAVLLLAADPPWAPRGLRKPGGAAPVGRVELVGFGLDAPAQSRGFGVKRRVPALVSGWGCDGARARTTGCDPAREMVIPPTSGSDTCNGDSGGPVFELASGTWRLVGITSRPTVAGAGACGRGGIYTRVDAVADWLAPYLGGRP